MGFDILVSSSFQRFFDQLDEGPQGRILEALEVLREDPHRARPGADIKRLANTAPVKHRLRVGDWRIVYHIDKDERVVRVIDGFRRGRGYRP